jgi:hypothetical protein
MKAARGDEEEGRKGNRMKRTGGRKRERERKWDECSHRGGRGREEGVG